MALVGNMIATAYAGNPSLVNYDMFVAVFSMLTLFYLIPATIKESFQGHPLLMVVLDVLNAIFYFCGAVAMAARLHVHSCSNSVSFLTSDVISSTVEANRDGQSYTTTNSITNGSHDTGKRCREAQATTAFLWFGFAAFVVSAVLSGMQSGGSGMSMRRGGAGGIRKGPAMSQV